MAVDKFYRYLVYGSVNICQRVIQNIQILTRKWYRCIPTSILLHNMLLYFFLFHNLSMRVGIYYNKLQYLFIFFCSTQSANYIDSYRYFGLSKINIRIFMTVAWYITLNLLVNINCSFLCSFILIIYLKLIIYWSF